MFGRDVKVGGRDALLGAVAVARDVAVAQRDSYLVAVIRVVAIARRDVTGAPQEATRTSESASPCEPRQLTWTNAEIPTIRPLSTQTLPRGFIVAKPSGTTW
jgi:hypothetical protein